MMNLAWHEVCHIPIAKTINPGNARLTAIFACQNEALASRACSFFSILSKTRRTLMLPPADRGCGGVDGPSRSGLKPNKAPEYPTGLAHIRVLRLVPVT